MAITSLDQLIASAKDTVGLIKTASRTTVAAGWFSVFDLAGNPGAGVLAGANTANGVVPDDTVTGFPSIASVGGSAVGYLAACDFGNTVAARHRLCDCLFKAGAYAFTGATSTLASQPSYSARIPNADYKDTQIWIEVSTAFVTGTQWSVVVTYTNQSGVAARSTAAISTLNVAALTLGRMYQLPLQAGDTGVQKIESVIVTNAGTLMTAGAFNVLVLRPLWTGRSRLANDGDVHDFTKTGLARLYDSTALYLLVCADSTSTGLPEILMTIANG
jgi:hypothetical protein